MNPMNELPRGFPVARCRGCGVLYFPRRLICRACGNDTWNEERLDEAVIDEATVVVHVAGGARAKPRHLATVRTAEGLRLVVGLETPLADGTQVLLFEKDGAPVARAR
jgi:uncharacterized OB-fold protein